MYMNIILCWVGVFLIALAVLYGIKNAMNTKEAYSSINALDFFIPTYQACRAQGYSREFLLAIT